MGANIFNPSGYYDRIQQSNGTATDNYIWAKLLYKSGFVGQAAEQNENQDLARVQFQKLCQGFYSDGQFLNGGSITTSTVDSQITVNITAGQVYALGFIHDVPAGSTTITGTGTETINLIIDGQILTAVSDVPNTIYDATLTDPDSGAENYQQPGADRLIFTYTYASDTNQGVVVATFINGQLVENTSSNSLWNQILALLAERTYEESGSFLAEQPSTVFADLQAPSANPAQIQLEIDGGIGYVEGYRVTNTKTLLSVLRPMTGQARLVEPHEYMSGTKVYTLDNTPVLGIDQVEALLESGDISMTRGNVVNGQDLVPTQYQPVQTVISITQGMTTFVSGTDYSLIGNYISWLSGGSQPATGSTYTLVVEYTDVLTKGIRTLTTVTAESHTVGSMAVTTTHADVSEIISITDVTTSTTVPPSDYSVVTNTGVISFTGGVSNSDTVYVTYTYWAHTTEGDYVGRDSFVDSAGDILYYSSPTLTPSGDSVDFTTQISLDTTSGNTPVNTSNPLYSYHYTLGRVDVLAWHVDGIFYVLQGTPSLTPVPVSPTPDYLPICNINLPPEAFAANVTVELYNNLTMKVTDLRTLQNQVFNLQYDVAQFQLQQSALNKTQPTDIIGIFADDFSTPALGDLSNEAFAVTYDFLDGIVSLPRTGGEQSPAVSSTAGCTLYEDMYFNNFSEILGAQQIYQSTPLVINQLGAVNQKATVILSPNADLGLSANDLQIGIQQVSQNVAPNIEGFVPGVGHQVSIPMPWQNVKNGLLLINTSPNSAVAAQIGADTSSIPNPVLNQVPVNLLGATPDATAYFTGTESPPANAQVVVQNNWATVLATQQVVTNSVAGTPTVAVTGSNFRANDKAITCLFDGQTIALTATGSTVAESNPAYPNCVTANSTGAFTASFVVPSNTAQGIHTVQFVSHESADYSIVSSIATTSYVAGGYVEYVDLWVSLLTPPTTMPTEFIPLYVLTEILGVGIPNSYGLNSVTGPLAYTIAYAIAQSIAQDIVVTNDLLFTAVHTMFLYTTLGDTLSNPSVAAIVNACNLSSTNIQANANAMLAASPYAGLALANIAQRTLDPLGQTFTFNSNTTLTSINLYFAVAPSSTNPITVSICQTNAGNPTPTYIANSTVSGGSITTTGATKFTFPKPVWLQAGTQYAFVVQTQDTTAALWSAVLGQTDPNNGLIAANPAGGALLQSPDGVSWQLLAGQNLKYDLNIANFTVTQGIVNYGEVTFPQTSSLFALDTPYALPSQYTTVQYQWSEDNSTWNDFAPLVEVDLGSPANGGTSEASLYFRILLNGTATETPTLANVSTLCSYINQSSGEYVHRQFTIPIASAGQYVNVYADVTLPGSTTLTFAQSINGGSTWQTMTHVTADDIQISDTVTERHYQYENSSGSVTECITRVQLATSATPVTPTVGAYRVIVN
jgi:Domain of unknown function (DUF4815)